MRRWAVLFAGPASPTCQWERRLEEVVTNDQNVVMATRRDREVGVRELKAHLSEHLRNAQRGQVILVTDRGRPVARIVPAGLPEGIVRLIQEGRLTWSGRPFRVPRERPRVRGRPNLADIVIADRG